MSITNRLSMLAGMAVVLTPLAPASAEETVAPQSGAWSSADEVRSIVAEMLSDAQTRTSLLQLGGTAGHDDDFFLASSDGNFRLNIGGQIQFRYYLNYRDDNIVNLTDANGDLVIDQLDADLLAQDDFQSGFQTRRTKLIFDGHVFEPALFYKIKGNFDRDGGSFNLEDAFVGYNFDNGFTVRWGQFKLPLLREELVSSSRQLAADRSLTNEVFNQDRSQGIELSYNDEMWRTAVAFSDGIRSANSDVDEDRTFGSGTRPIGSGTEAQWALTGRVEILFAGTWGQFRDFTSNHDDDMGLMFGIAGHIEGGDSSHNAFGSGATGFSGSFPGGGDYTYSTWTVDLSFESQGFSAFVAFIGSHSSSEDVLTDLTDPTSLTADVDNDDFGFVFQVGARIPNSDWEAFARYDVLLPDDSDRRTSNDAFSTATVGANYYMHGHAAKFTADVSWYLDDVNELSGPNTGIGYFQDDESDEITIRLQFQLLF